MVKICFLSNVTFLISKVCFTSRSLNTSYIFTPISLCCVSAMTHYMIASIFSWTQSFPGFILVSHMCLALIRLVHVTFGLHNFFINIYTVYIFILKFNSSSFNVSSCIAYIFVMPAI